MCAAWRGGDWLKSGDAILLGAAGYQVRDAVCEGPGEVGAVRGGDEKHENDVLGFTMMMREMLALVCTSRHSMQAAGRDVQCSSHKFTQPFLNLNIQHDYFPFIYNESTVGDMGLTM